VCAECRYPTHAEIYDYFKNFAMPATPNIADWTLDVMTQLLTNPVGVTAKVAYFTLMTWQLGIIYLKAKFASASENSQLLHWATLGEDFANDNWLALCDTCNENYVQWDWDFTAQGQGDWYRAQGFSGSAGGTFIAGKGWRLDNVVGGQAMNVGMAFDPNWQVRGFAYKVSFPNAEIDQNNWQFRTLPSTAAATITTQGSIVPSGFTRCREGLLSISGYQEAALRLTVPTQDAQRYLEKVRILFNKQHSPSSNVIRTSDVSICS
jgi:hypothetical protein